MFMSSGKKREKTRDVKANYLPLHRAFPSIWRLWANAKLALNFGFCG
jgi:hypothetical protein